MWPFKKRNKEREELIIYYIIGLNKLQTSDNHSILRYKLVGIRPVFYTVRWWAKFRFWSLERRSEGEFRWQSYALFSGTIDELLTHDHKLVREYAVSILSSISQ